ncbi:AP-5 complex subunit zeta-1 [Linum perenne]
MRDGDKEWDFYLRSLSNIARDSNLASDPASDPSLLNSVRKLYQLCKEENSEDLVARVYPHLSKIFQRTVASLSQSTSSCGLLLLAIIQFFLDFGEIVLHDADPSLRTFFRSCLSREFADITIAEATLEFLNVNKRKLLASYPALLPQFFPLLLKLIAWNGERLQKSFLKVFPELISPASFLPLFPSLVDLPILVVALERVERSSGSRIGSSIATIQKSTAPEERHRTSPGMAAALQALVNAPQSDRLKQSLKISPRLLDVYCAVAIRDVNDSLNCALIPLLMARNDALFPDKYYCYQVRKKLLEYMLASFQRSPNFVALLKKPIMNRLGEAYDSPAKVARSRISDVRVWRRARDYLGLIDDPAISLSVLGPCWPSQGHVQKPGTVNWSDGGTKFIAHIPFYLLGEQEGYPFHDFSFSDIFPRS